MEKICVKIGIASLVFAVKIL